MGKQFGFYVTKLDMKFDQLQRVDIPQVIAGEIAKQ